jgi:3-deoxy-manno-octulosonate cytidylyltransferase (CMP-KDO synthetase)
VNVQGDEPFVTATSLDRLVEAFDEAPPPEMATLVETMQTMDEVSDPNVVKVVTTLDGRALYFSRAPIPYDRADGRSASASEAAAGYRKHQGIYAYRRETLLALTRLPPSPLEKKEGLEQLRALQAGFTIRVLDSDFRSVAVDTPADLERATALLVPSKEARR